MDDHRSADALTDVALDRELEAALAVDSSPEFVARVRMRVQRERDAASSPWPWRIAAAIAFVAVIALVVGMSRQDRRVARDESLAQRQPTVAPGAQDVGPGPVAQGSAAGQAFTPAPPAASRKSAGKRRRPGAAVSEPELLIAADEARALRQLFANVRKGRIDLSSLQEGAPATAALQAPSVIAFSPITFEPIAPEPVEEGARQ
jgi:hypothetical protein